MSRTTLTNPHNLPDVSSKGRTIPLPQKRSPPLRMCQRSSSARPRMLASSSSHRGTPARISSGVKIASKGRPRISASEKPSTCSAPRFQPETRPSVSSVMMA
jgi:hypothetical protein